MAWERELTSFMCVLPCPGLVPQVHHVLYLLDILGDRRRTGHDVDACLRVLLQLSLLPGSLEAGLSNLLLVDLQVGGPDQVLLVLGARDVGEDMLKGIGDDPAGSGSTQVPCMV